MSCVSRVFFVRFRIQEYLKVSELVQTQRSAISSSMTISSLFACQARRIQNQSMGSKEHVVVAVVASLTTVLVLQVFFPRSEPLRTHCKATLCPPCPSAIPQHQQTSAPPANACPPANAIKLHTQFAEKMFASSNIDSKVGLKSIVDFRTNGSILVVGANIGDTNNDPEWQLMKKNVAFKKYYVEPIPTLFKQLQQNIKRSRVANATLINAAISDKVGETDMFCWRLNETDGTSVVKGVPRWFTQICSFNKSRLTSHPHDTGGVSLSHLGNVDDHIVNMKVQTLNVPALFEKYNIQDIRYVQIDAEGFDYHIVKQLPFDNPSFRPDVIVYEDVLLTKEQNNFLQNTFRDYGYVIRIERKNAVGYRVMEGT